MISSMDSGLKFIQINLQHSKAATALLSRQHAVGHSDISLIQEPWLNRGLVKGLGSGGRLFYSSENNPRACILVAKHVKAALTSFCSRDIVAVQVQYKQREINKEIVVCSAYFPFDSPDPPPTREFMDLVNYCRDRKVDLLVGCDANAHHQAWGSSDINRRGSSLLEYLVSTDLVILNRGNEPTFANRLRQEVLDITLCSASLCQDVTNWIVSSEPSLSDHRQIRFIVTSDKREPVVYRNPRTTDWASYKEDLTNGINCLLMKPRKPAEIDLAANQLQRLIKTSYTDNCPLRKAKGPKDPPWWNANLSHLRKETCRLLNRAKQRIDTSDWERFRNAQKAYKSAIRHAKRESWKHFCQEVESLPAATRVHKTLSKDPKAFMGSMKLPTGDLVTSGKEILNHLVETHFPGSVETDGTTEVESMDVSTSRIDWAIASKAVTHRKIRWAIMSFAPFKAAGEDGIFPALLQEGLEILITPLFHIFKACIAWGYVPIAWRTSKVIFIPKPGKTTYTQAKSFRPICLTSFLLKTLERLVDRYIRDGALVHYPLHPNQHAYQAGKSVETALHSLVSKIEESLDSKQLALGTFLDIEGAFDNTNFDSICKAAQRHGIANTIVKWIGNMLKSRKITVSYFEDKIEATVSRGCPQGGVLSPLLWCLVVNELLTKISQNGMFVQGYADDLVILIRGRFPGTLCDITQQALRLVETWCDDNGLSVNPTKTELVLFTKKRNVQDFYEPKLYGNNIQLKNQAKYLGVILDSKLSWKNHVELKVNKACKTLWMCRQLFGKSWGLSPRIIHWLYTAIVRPMLTYAALVWWPRVTLSTTRASLNHIQRLACLGITGAMRSAPTAALEVLLCLPPLHLVVEAEAAAAAYRLTINGWWGTDREHLGHSAVLRRLRGNSCLLMSSDHMTPRYSFEKTYGITLPTREDWQHQELWLDANKPGGLVWFTDGSKTSVGTGAGIFGWSPRSELSFALGEHATVFQAEVYAITACISENIKKAYENKHIYIYTDSQAALRALDSPRITSRLVWDCKMTIKTVKRTGLILYGFPVTEE